MKFFRLNKAAALIVVLTSSSAAVGALTSGTYETTGKAITVRLLFKRPLKILKSKTSKF